MPSKILRIIFFATRAVVSAGNNATSIYVTGLYVPRVRSFAYGIMSTFFRIGVLTSPYLGQVFLQRVSVLGTILIFSALAISGSLLSLFLPHVDDKVSIKIKKNNAIFKNIFKSCKTRHENQISVKSQHIPNDYTSSEHRIEKTENCFKISSNTDKKIAVLEATDITKKQ